MNAWTRTYLSEADFWSYYFQTLLLWHSNGNQFQLKMYKYIHRSSRIKTTKSLYIFSYLYDWIFFILFATFYCLCTRCPDKIRFTERLTLTSVRYRKPVGWRPPPRTTCCWPTWTDCGWTLGAVVWFAAVRGQFRHCRCRHRRSCCALVWRAPRQWRAPKTATRRTWRSRPPHRRTRRWSTPPGTAATKSWRPRAYV